MKRKNVAILAISALMLIGVGGNLLTSCQQQEEQKKEDIKVDSVVLSSSKKSIKVGEELKLNVTITPQDATNKEVIFTVDNASVASVSDDGTLKGLSIGTAIVTVTTKDQNKTSNISITVVDADTELLDLDGYVEKMSSTPYSSNITGEATYGLSDGKNVGVNEEESKTELYPIPGDSEFNSDEIIDVNTLTLAKVQEVIPGATTLTNYEKIQGALLLAKNLNASGKKAKIKLPSGNLNVNCSAVTTSYVFVVDGLEKTYIEGNGSVINIEINDLNYKGYLNITNSKDVYINGVTFKQAVPANVTGVISNYDIKNRKISFKVDSEFNETIKRASSLNKPIRSYLEFNARSKAPRQGGNFLVDSFASYATKGNETSGYEVEVTFNTSINEPPLNTLVSIQFAQYDAGGIGISSSENIYVENLTLNSAYGMGFTASTVNNLFINRYNLCVAEGSNALMTSCADAMHFSNLSGDVKVTNSLIEYSHDDALNIKHGYWYSVNSASASTKKLTLGKITSGMSIPKEGDKIAIYEEGTFISHNPSSGYYTVVSATEVLGKYEVVVNERMTGVASWGNCRATFLSNTPNFEFKNNIIRNKRNRGILVQVPGALIENNTFMNVGHGSIQAATSFDVYNEATIPQGITIRNNKFINNCYIKGGTLLGDISVFAIGNTAEVAPAGTISNVNIDNNFFTNNGDSCVSFRGVGTSSSKNNLFYNVSSSQPMGEAYKCIYSMENVDDISIEGNYNYTTLDNDLSGVMVAGTSKEEDITLKDNKNINFYVSSDVGPEIDIAKLNKTVTVDGDVSDWEGSNATNIDIVGITDAEGTQFDNDSLKDHFEVKKLMMSWNDQGILLGFDIYDNDIKCKTINDFWLGDCVEIMASTITNMPNADLKVYKDEGGVMQAAFAPTWSSNNYSTLTEVRTNKTYMDNKNLLNAVLKTNASGYSGEVLIPFTLAPEFKTAIDEGKRIDMAIICADCERTGIKRIQESNVPHNVENNKTKTARMPQYLFKN